MKKLKQVHVVAFSAICAIMLAPDVSAAQSNNALDLQETRNKMVADTGKTVHYPADKFNLSALPEYKPQTKVSGTIRISGNNYIGDSPLGGYWMDAFRKHHPEAKFETNLHTAAIAIGSLYSKSADIGASGRRALWIEHLAFQRTFGYNVTEVVVTTGSYDVPGWSNTLVFFVNKENPVSQLSFEQLDGIFGSEREGGWIRGNQEWSTAVARTPEKDIRTWGQLGLAGKWADQPINPYGLNLRYEQSLRVSDPILKGSDKWNERIKLYANYPGPDGVLKRAADQVADNVARDIYGIGYGSIRDMGPQHKIIALSKNNDGNYIYPTIETVQNRSYPLIGETFFYINRAPGEEMDPKVREFTRFVLSREGQTLVARDGKYLPLTVEALEQQRKLLD